MARGLPTGPVFEELLDDDARRTKMGERGYESVHHRYDCKHIAARFEAHLERLLDPAAPRGGTGRVRGGSGAVTVTDDTQIPKLVDPAKLPLLYPTARDTHARHLLGVADRKLGMLLQTLRESPTETETQTANRCSEDDEAIPGRFPGERPAGNLFSPDALL